MTRPITEDDLDVKRMAEETEIPSYKIRRALELPLSAVEEHFAEMLNKAVTPDAIKRVLSLVKLETTVDGAAYESSSTSRPHAKRFSASATAFQALTRKSTAPMRSS